MKTTCLAILFVLACSIPGARAQVLYGSLVVEAHDESGVLPGATVTITQTETGWTAARKPRPAAPSPSAPCRPARSVKINLQGFKESLTTAVAVTEGGAIGVSSALQVGQLSESVTVTAGETMLQTERAEVRTELTATQLTNVPMPVGRNYRASS